MTLELNEIQFIKHAIEMSDPFATVEEAKQRIYTTCQRIDDLKEQLEIDEVALAKLENRDNMIKVLKKKLEEEEQ